MADRSDILNSAWRILMFGFWFCVIMGFSIDAGCTRWDSQVHVSRVNNLWTERITFKNKSLYRSMSFHIANASLNGVDAMSIPPGQEVSHGGAKDLVVYFLSDSAQVGVAAHVKVVYWTNANEYQMHTIDEKVVAE